MLYGRKIKTGEMTLITLCLLLFAILFLLVAALIVYIERVHHRLYKAIRLARLPEVLRDGLGRPLHERL
jgi:K+-transporting ATPase A subunit